MLLQILPPDFQYEPEVSIVNKAEITSFICLCLAFGLVFWVKFFNSKKPSLFSEIKDRFNFIMKTIRKDLEIN